MLYISEVGKVWKFKPRIKNGYCSFLDLTNHSYEKSLETSDVEGELWNLPDFLKKEVYLFIWLCRVLGVACGIFGCSM